MTAVCFICFGAHKARLQHENRLFTEIREEMREGDKHYFQIRFVYAILWIMVFNAISRAETKC